MRWYRRVTNSADGDFTAVADALEYYEAEYEKARSEVKITSGRVEALAMRLPGLVEYHYGHLQELEAILKWLEIQTEKVLGKCRRHYMEHYNKTLSDRTAEKYAESDNDVITLKLLTNEVALVRNNFLGIHKAIEFAHYQTSNITKLRCAGMEDSSL